MVVKRELTKPVVLFLGAGKGEGRIAGAVRVDMTGLTMFVTLRGC